MTTGAGLFDLHGRTALVTGAGRGIGRTLALGLASAGADLVVHGRDETALAEVMTKVRVLGRTATPWVLDLRDPGAIAASASALPAVDILVNNAGIIHRAPAEEQTPDVVRRVLAVDLDAVLELSRVIGAGMLDRGHGKIINLASLLSFQGGTGVASYTVSKHGVVGITRALATEWARRGVQVNAIAPGYIETDITESLRADPGREPAIRDRIPAGRWGRPEDLVGATVFLASAASDYVAGHVLVVDGGWMSR